MQNTSGTNGTVFIQSGGLSLLADRYGFGNGTGIDLDCSSVGSGNVRVCIAAPFSGQFIFTWSWSWSDGSSSSFAREPFGYCLNGVPTTLTNGVGGGNETVNVAAGDTFCFVVSSQFANSHPTLPTSIGVTNFSRSCPSEGCQAGFTHMVSSVLDSILFTDNSVGTINSRTWYFGDGSTSKLLIQHISIQVRETIMSVLQLMLQVPAWILAAKLL